MPIARTKLQRLRGSTLLPPFGDAHYPITLGTAWNTRLLSPMQLGSGFRNLSPGVSHPPKRTPSQRRNRKLLVFVIAVTEKIAQRVWDNQEASRQLSIIHEASRSEHPKHLAPDCIVGVHTEAHALITRVLHAFSGIMHVHSSLHRL